MARAANTTHTRIAALVCLLAVLLLALPSGSAQSTGSAQATSACDPCCPARVGAIPACCLANPQPAAVVPFPLHADCPEQPDSFLVPGEAIVTASVASSAGLRIARPPLLETNLRI